MHLFWVLLLTAAAIRIGAFLIAELIKQKAAHVQTQAQAQTQTQAASRRQSSPSASMQPPRPLKPFASRAFRNAERKRYQLSH